MCKKQNSHKRNQDSSFFARVLLCMCVSVCACVPKVLMANDLNSEMWISHVIKWTNKRKGLRLSATERERMFLSQNFTRADRWQCEVEEEEAEE